MNPLKKLFLHEMGCRHDAEKRLSRALPRIIKTAGCKSLQKLLHVHLKSTHGHLRILDKIFASFDEKSRPRKCGAIPGLLLDHETAVTVFKGSPALNAALVCSLQKIVHWEIASYGCLHEWAGMLGNAKAAGLLSEILVEEKFMNDALIALARSRCNPEALGEPRPLPEKTRK